MSRNINRRRGWLGSFSFHDDEWVPRRKRNFWSFERSRQEMVSPYMLSYDASRLYDVVKKGFRKVAVAFTGTTDERAGKIAEMLDKCIPSHLVQDIYSLYFNKSEDQEFCIVDDTNRGKFDLLQSVNDSSIKIITNHSSILSTLFTGEIAMGIARSILAALSAKDMADMGTMMGNSKAEKNNDDESNDGNQSGTQESEDQGNNTGADQPEDSKENDGKGTEQGDKEKGKDKKGSEGSSGKKTTKKPVTTPFEKVVKKMADEISKHVGEAKSNAFNKIAELESMGFEIGKMAGSSEEATKMLLSIDKIKQQISTIHTKSKSLKPIIDKIVDTSRSYFSSKYKIQEVSIFEADEFDDLDGLEFLNPVMKNVMLEDVITREAKYYGKMNVYIDISPSMDSDIRINGVAIPTLVFAKAIAIRLLDMNIVNRVIPFNSNVKPAIDNPNALNILLLDTTGGTCINNVVRDCEKRMENALIITDCQDEITLSSPHCFILGTPGARFNLFGLGVGLRDQLWFFNGKGTDIVKYSKMGEEEEEDQPVLDIW